MEYTDLFRRFGSPSTTAEHRVYIYVETPESLKSAKEISYRDHSAAQNIAEMEKYIELLKLYRIELARRYSQLETMSYKDTLYLERSPHWKGHIEYVIRIERVMEDGTKTEPFRETFPGKERHKAFARFDELRKQHPGIEAVKDIERRPWER